MSLWNKLPREIKIEIYCEAHDNFRPQMNKVIEEIEKVVAIFHNTVRQIPSPRYYYRYWTRTLYIEDSTNHGPLLWRGRTWPAEGWIKILGAGGLVWDFPPVNPKYWRD